MSRKCNISKGDIQCRYIKIQGFSVSEGYLCCRLVEGHKDAHTDSYGGTHGRWTENPNYLRMQKIKKRVLDILSGFHNVDEIIETLDKEVFKKWNQIL